MLGDSTVASKLPHVSLHFSLCLPTPTPSFLPLSSVATPPPPPAHFFPSSCTPVCALSLSPPPHLSDSSTTTHAVPSSPPPPPPPCSPLFPLPPMLPDPHAVFSSTPHAVPPPYCSPPHPHTHTSHAAPSVYFVITLVRSYRTQNMCRILSNVFRLSVCVNKKTMSTEKKCLSTVSS